MMRFYKPAGVTGRPSVLPVLTQMERFLTIREDRATEKERKEGDVF